MGIIVNEMAKIKKEDFIKSLKEMTLLEINELVEALKEEFGIDPTAQVAAASASATVEADTPSVVNLVLTNVGPNKIQVIKLIREITSLGLKEAKDIADAGGNIKDNLNLDEANELKAKFEEIGAVVELK